MYYICSYDMLPLCIMFCIIYCYIAIIEFIYAPFAGMPGIPPIAGIPGMPGLVGIFVFWFRLLSIGGMT